MKGLILAGGYATRLRPLSCSKPKLLFPIVGVPLINLMVDWLRTAGVTEVILAINHLADQLQNEVGDELNGSKIVYSIEREPLGTGGPIRLARKKLGDDDFIVLNGDIVSDMNLAEMVKAHRESQAEATIALVKVKDATPYGLVHLVKNSMVDRFEEKTQKTKEPGLVNAGVYILTPKVLEKIPGNGMVSIERHVFPELAREGRMQGWAHENGYWYDIGKIPDYIRVNRELLEKEWANNHPEKKGGPYRVGKHSTVEDTASIGPYSILSDDVTVKTGASLNNTIVFEESLIGENSSLEGAIIGEKVTVGPRVHVGNGSLVAGQISIPAGRVYPANSVILTG